MIALVYEVTKARATNMDKIIEMHGIELDNTYNSVQQVNLACIICET